MEDRDLLVYAAHAMGLGLTTENYIAPEEIEGHPWGLCIDMNHVWNPLINDADRYQLIKRLRINLNFENRSAWSTCRLEVIQKFWETDGGEDLAVVQVAAAIGHQLWGTK